MRTTDIALNVGDIVIIPDYGNTKWLTCYGWYTYHNSRLNGWYFRSIPEGNIVPESEIDTYSIRLVTPSESSDSCGCNRPRPYPPTGSNVPCSDECECDDPTPFVTVDTINQRNSLGDPYPKDGAMVRVNNVKGETKYYQWDAENLVWTQLSFPVFIDGEPIQDKITEIDLTINELKDLHEWVLLNRLVSVVD